MDRTLPRRAARADLPFVALCALLFAASVAATLAQHASMATMGELPLPGGGSLSMLWMPTCGRTWARAAASFVGMWIVMMAAMMLPSLGAMLLRYRATVGARVQAGRLAGLTLLVAGGYALVWSALGLAVFMVGAAFAMLELRWPLLAHGMPSITGVVVLLAGAVQCSAWKARHLACCRATPSFAAGPAGAFRYGVRTGIHCCCSCAGVTALLVVVGVSDLRLMAALTAAITAERLLPDGIRVARTSGMLAVGGGLLLIAQAAAVG
ncbi:DUF2182 domain-containing protein [Paraburkholderia sp. MMS20-SJTR3]|uniref:DUF2182 domain-containing protein n=1 Tax=Paraburkholderia sejongensis TaxID=2886946 RepID=A0ABS8K5S1_9BURK|nr:DUF2182 domain-containing protein [Paraburkholderia sp. MMS20-SJTR3]MCC8397519.1 DUF2182 domain-containing protein [Paraburkholderia sp. MMS20-SJTR3]